MATEGRRAAALDGAHHLHLGMTEEALIGTTPAGPWSRKMSATSRAGRPTNAAGYFGGVSLLGTNGVSRSSGLGTCQTLLATCA